jgi:hypothetical protein
VPQLRDTDPSLDRRRPPGDRLERPAVGYAPGVPICGEPVGRLGGQGRFGLQLGDAGPCCDQLALVGGDDAVQVGKPTGGIGGPGRGTEAGELFIALTAGLGQSLPSLLVCVLSGIDGRAKLGVLRVGACGGAAGGGVERRPYSRPVIEPAGDLRDVVGVGGELR